MSYLDNNQCLLLVKNQRFLSMLGNCNNLLYIFAISDILRMDNNCSIFFVREYSNKSYFQLFLPIIAYHLGFFCGNPNIFFRIV